VWLVIFATFGIYLSAGKVVLEWRRQLLTYAAETHAHDLEIKINAQRRQQQQEDEEEALSRSAPMGITKTTQFYMTTENAPASDYTTDVYQQPTRYELKRPAVHHDSQRFSLPSIDANSAALSYCKCALLFFVALLVTWVPSTINRVVTLVHPTHAIYGLDYASGMVLPLQGFWNAAIYILTSLPACKALWSRITRRSDVLSLKRKSLFSVASERSGRTGTSGSGDDQETCSESLKKLRRASEGEEGLGIAV